MSALEAAVKITSRPGYTIDVNSLNMPPLSEEDVDKLLKSLSKTGISLVSSPKQEEPPYIKIAQIIYEWMVKDDPLVQQLLDSTHE